MTYIAAAIMLGFGSLAAAVGIGMLGAQYIAALARNEHNLPLLQPQFFITMGLIDAMPVISVAMGLYVLFAV